MIFQHEDDVEHEHDERLDQSHFHSQSLKHAQNMSLTTTPMVTSDHQRAARLDRECISTIMSSAVGVMATEENDEENEGRLSSSLHRLQLDPPSISYDVGHQALLSPRITGRPSLSSSSSSPLPSSSVCRSSSSPFSRAAARARAADRTPPSSSSSSFATYVLQSHSHHHQQQQQQRVVDTGSLTRARGSSSASNSLSSSHGSMTVEPVAFRARPCAPPGVEITRPVPLRSRAPPPPSVNSVPLASSPRSTTTHTTSPSLRPATSHRGVLGRPVSPRFPLRSASPRSCGANTSGSGSGSARAARSWSTGEMRPSTFANAAVGCHNSSHGGSNGGTLLHGVGSCHTQVVPPPPNRVVSFGSAVTPPSSTTDGDDTRASWEWCAEQDALRRRRVATFLTSASNSSSSSVGSAPPSLLVDRLEFSASMPHSNNNSNNLNHGNVNSNHNNSNSTNPSSSLFSCHHHHNHLLHHHHHSQYGYCHHHHSNVMPHRSFSRARFQGPHVRQARSLSALAGDAQNQHRVPSPVSPRVIRRVDGPRVWDSHEGSSPLPAVRHASAFRFRKLPSRRASPPDAFQARNVYQNYHPHHLNLHHHISRDRGEDCFLGDPPLNSHGRTRRRFRLFKRKLSVSALRWGSNNG